MNITTSRTSGGKLAKGGAFGEAQAPVERDGVGQEPRGLEPHRAGAAVLGVVEAGCDQCRAQARAARLCADIEPVQFGGAVRRGFLEAAAHRRVTASREKDRGVRSGEAVGEGGEEGLPSVRGVMGTDFGAVVGEGRKLPGQLVAAKPPNRRDVRVGRGDCQREIQFANPAVVAPMWRTVGGRVNPAVRQSVRRTPQFS